MDGPFRTATPDEYGIPAQPLQAGPIPQANQSAWYRKLMAAVLAQNSPGARAAAPQVPEQGGASVSNQYRDIGADAMGIAKNLLKFRRGGIRPPYVPALVGEEGPELAINPDGSTEMVGTGGPQLIVPNRLTAALAAGAPMPVSPAPGPPPAMNPRQDRYAELLQQGAPPKPKPGLLRNVLAGLAGAGVGAAEGYLATTQRRPMTGMGANVRNAIRLPGYASAMEQYGQDLGLAKTGAEEERAQQQMQYAGMDDTRRAKQADAAIAASNAARARAERVEAPTPDRRVLSPGQVLTEDGREVYAAPNRPEATPDPSLVFERHTDDVTGNVTVIGRDPKTGAERSRTVEKGVSRSKPTAPPRERAGSWTLLETDSGLVFFNPETGQTKAASPGARRPESAPRPVTGQERQTLAFYNRAKGALNDIGTPAKDGSTIEDRIANSSPKQVGLSLPNAMQPKDVQNYVQAQKTFTEARLRKESGAAIPPHEYENDAKMYFVQLGDTPENVKQKRLARQAVLDGLKFSSGRAYEEYYGEPSTPPQQSVPPTATPAATTAPRGQAANSAGDTVRVLHPDGKTTGRIPRGELAAAKLKGFTEIK